MNDETRKPAPIATYRHLAGFFLIIALTLVVGFQISARANASLSSDAATEPTTELTNDSTPPPPTANHFATYLTFAIADLAFLYYCWGGVHHTGKSLFKLARLADGPTREWLVDAAVAVPFILLWHTLAYVIAVRLNSGSKTVNAMLPTSLRDVLMWIALSCTAGFCEELIFRVYLQRQLHALLGSLPLAILGQAVVFGLAHAYQGWRPVVVISVLGILYGLLAAIRPSLRANIFSHAFSDIWEGWLKFVVMR